MSEMVERVARAIEAARGTPTDVPTPVAYRMARAAIEAMREPTEAMCREIDGMVAVTVTAEGQIIGEGASADRWRRMIDEALK